MAGNTKQEKESKMYKVTIKTNNHDRLFLYRYEVPEKILKSEFDYQNEEETTDGYIKYRGEYYHLDQFVRCTVERDEKSSTSPISDYDGILHDSAFSGILIKVSDDMETYRIARFYF